MLWELSGTNKKRTFDEAELTFFKWHLKCFYIYSASDSVAFRQWSDIFFVYSHQSGEFDFWPECLRRKVFDF